MTDAAVMRLPAAQPSRLQQLQSRGRLRGTFALLGPAFVACIAYVDPGNFATNIAGGAKYGYLLLWVLLSANLMAMLIQNLSAKIGIATGRNLAELCRDHFPRPVDVGPVGPGRAHRHGHRPGGVRRRRDRAEPALPRAALRRGPHHGGHRLRDPRRCRAKGYRRFEAVIAGLLGLIILGFLYDTLKIGFDAGAAAKGFIPGFAGTDSVLLATAILGATVMPHVIYLHSALTQGRVPPRDDAERKRLLRFQRIDVSLAMGIAGLVNMSMLVIAAALFHDRGLLGLDSIEEAHAQFTALAGGGAALAFAVALLASGLASSSVGTYAGQVVMQGFIARTIPIVLRRLITMTPALIVLAIGLNPSRSLVISQVVLSFGIPFALVPLVLLTRRKDIMGPLVNRRLTTVVASIVAALIIALNLFLIVDTLFG